MSIKLLTLPSGIICPMEVLCPELSGNAHHEQQKNDDMKHSLPTLLARDVPWC